jgi:nucleotide-binding universal stress UspA family protein
MFDDILVPTDGSDCAEAAEGYAADLAARYGATVHVLCVVDSRLLENAPQYDRVKAEHRETAEQTCNEISGRDVAAERAVRTDVPHEAILTYATDEDIDLIVMGTHGRTGVDRYLLGSVTEKVVRMADPPVLTVKASDDVADTYPYTDILVPTDGSEGSEAAFPPAVDIATTYDARLHGISVVDTVSLGFDVRSSGMLDALEESARGALERLEQRAARSSITAVETAIRHGTPFSEIHSHVEEHDIDLVVMGTHGRSGLERYLLGSVTEKIVRTSSVPVLTVRQPE